MHERNNQLRDRHLDLLKAIGHQGTRMRLPIVNLNGTDAGQLIKQMLKVNDKFNELLNAIGEATPHDRDFQLNVPHSEGAVTRGAWDERRRLLAAIQNEFMAYASGVNLQRR